MNRTRKLKISLITILVTFLVGVSAWIFYNSSVFQSPQLEIPTARWEKLFFENIDEVTELAKIPKLREEHLAKSDLEIRVWQGFGLEDLEGMIFRRIDDKWTAFYVNSNNYTKPTKAKVVQIYRLPKSGWNSFTKQIFDAGILTLPDSDSESMIDGRSYVVEIYKDKIYRTYKYESVSEPNFEEGRKINEIARIIAKEFYNGIDKCKEAEWLSCLSRDED